MSLFGRVVSINAGAIIAAALVLALSPVTVSARPQTTEIVVLALGTIVLLGVNVWLVRRAFEPLQRLAALMRKIDPHEPGRRIQLDGAVSEVADVTEAFNAMLDRIEQERMLSGRRALMAQENERKRLARELHDEVGQTLTGVMLQLEGIHRAAPPELGEAVAQLQETARGGVEEVREIARGLRPQALDEFGLRSALATLAAGFEERTRVRVRVRVAPRPARAGRRAGPRRLPRRPGGPDERRAPCRRRRGRAVAHARGRRRAAARGRRRPRDHARAGGGRLERARRDARAGAADRRRAVASARSPTAARRSRWRCRCG